MEYVIVWLLFGFVAMIIANVKGRSGCGWLILGVLLGPFSLVVALLPTADQKQRQQVAEGGSSDDYHKCPYCAEVIRREAIKCRFCGSDVKPAVEPAPRGNFGYEIGKAFGSGLAGSSPGDERSQLAKITGTILLWGLGIFLALVVVSKCAGT